MPEPPEGGTTNQEFVVPPSGGSRLKAGTTKASSKGGYRNNTINSSQASQRPTIHSWFHSTAICVSILRFPFAARRFWRAVFGSPLRYRRSADAGRAPVGHR